MTAGVPFVLGVIAGTPGGERIGVLSNLFLVEGLGSLELVPLAKAIMPPIMNIASNKPRMIGNDRLQYTVASPFLPFF